MGSARLPWSVVVVGLRARARGATWAEAEAICGVSWKTLHRRWIEESGVVLRDRKPRCGVLTLEDREEIRVGIERGSPTPRSLDGWVGIEARSAGRSAPTVVGSGIGRIGLRIVPIRQLAVPRPAGPSHRPWLWDEVQELLRDDVVTAADRAAVAP